MAIFGNNVSWVGKLGATFVGAGNKLNGPAVNIKLNKGRVIRIFFPDESADRGYSGVLVARGADDRIKVWYPKTGKCETLLKDKPYAFPEYFSANKKNVRNAFSLIKKDEETIRVISINKKGVVVMLNMLEHKMLAKGDEEDMFKLLWDPIVQHEQKGGKQSVLRFVALQERSLTEEEIKSAAAHNFPELTMAMPPLKRPYVNITNLKKLGEVIKGEYMDPITREKCSAAAVLFRVSLKGFIRGIGESRNESEEYYGIPVGFKADLAGKYLNKPVAFLNFRRTLKGIFPSYAEPSYDVKCIMMMSTGMFNG